MGWWRWSGEEEGWVSGDGLAEDEVWVGGGREKCLNYLHRRQACRHNDGAVDRWLFLGFTDNASLLPLAWAWHE